MKQTYRVSETSEMDVRFLEIERTCSKNGTRWTSVKCPFAPLETDNSLMSCGDWCPHFREGKDVGGMTGRPTVIISCGDRREIYVGQDPVADDS
jgi:hypothetical protein